jgi:hypothetical protein
MPESILEQLRQIGEQIRTAEAENAAHPERALWRKRRELITEPIADERRPADIRALRVRPQRASELIAA